MRIRLRLHQRHHLSRVRLGIDCGGQRVECTLVGLQETHRVHVRPVCLEGQHVRHVVHQLGSRIISHAADRQVQRVGNGVELNLEALQLALFCLAGDSDVERLREQGVAVDPAVQSVQV